MILEKHNNLVLVSPTTLSDHHPISISINLGCSPTLRNNVNNKFILNTSLLNDEDILAAISIIRLINESHYPSLSCIDRWTMNISAW